jgi:ABC-2 type transport system ATP-binding protein
MSEAGALIEVDGVVKHYGSVVALDGVSATISEQAVGLLGANGAGKSTLMRAMLGLIRPDRGSIRVLGLDSAARSWEIRRRLGYMPEHNALPLGMTARDLVVHMGELRGLPRRVAVLRASEVLFQVGLEEERSRLIRTFSVGMKQRTNLAQAIVHSPSLVILDEPTNGLDPAQIAQMRGLIKTLAETATVILSTHILQEVRAVCERVLVVNRGKLVLDARMDELAGASRLRLVTSGPPEKVEPLIAGLGLVTRVDRLADQGTGHAYALGLNGHGVETVAPAVARAITAGGLDLYALHPEQRDLEAVFAEITSVGAAHAEAHNA